MSLLKQEPASDKGKEVLLILYAREPAALN